MMPPPIPVSPARSSEPTMSNPRRAANREPETPKKKTPNRSSTSGIVNGDFVLFVGGGSVNQAGYSITCCRR